MNNLRGLEKCRLKDRKLAGRETVLNNTGCQEGIRKNQVGSAGPNNNTRKKTEKKEISGLFDVEDRLPN